MQLKPSSDPGFRRHTGPGPLASRDACRLRLETREFGRSYPRPPGSLPTVHRKVALCLRIGGSTEPTVPWKVGPSWGLIAASGQTLLHMTQQKSSFARLPNLPARPGYMGLTGTVDALGYGPASLRLGVSCPMARVCPLGCVGLRP